MSAHGFAAPAFQIGLALALGMIGQIFARHLRIPGIVVLLVIGVVIGPEALGFLRPEVLGDSLGTLVGFAVAVILFEGAAALDLGALKRHGLAIRRLVTVGVAITALLTTFAAHLLLGWGWTVAALFGTLMVVTGPTVVQPILRRIRVKPKVASVLEAEGILGDAVGATLAVVALEVVLAPAGESFSQGALGLLSRFGYGTLLGLLAGATITATLRFERLIPTDLRNVTTLALLLGFYQAGNALRSDSGVLVAVVAGLVVANLSGTPVRKLREFKEELAVLLIGLLFVLLAADVRLTDLKALGARGVLVVLLLIAVVRPLNVMVSTLGSQLTPRERVFMGWLAPRGIVAAAVATHFAQGLESGGAAGGRELQAMVFLVIATTVTLQGLSSGWLARRLGVALPPAKGWAILGANALGRLIGGKLAPPPELVYIDSNPLSCRQAEATGARAICSNALEEEIAGRSELAHAGSFLAITQNEEVNFLFARLIRDRFRKARIWVGLRRDHPGVSPALLESIGARCLFDGERDLEQWQRRVSLGQTVTTWWYPPAGSSALPREAAGDPVRDLLPLVVRFPDGEVVPFALDLKLPPQARIEILLASDTREEARRALVAAGFREGSSAAGLASPAGG